MPAGVEHAEVEMFRVEDPDPLIDIGSNVPEAPGGSPATVRYTVLANPIHRSDRYRVARAVAGVAEIEKSAVPWLTQKLLLYPMLVNAVGPNRSHSCTR